MNLSFRPAAEQDIPLISSLGHKVWNEHYPGIISQAQIDFMLSDRYSEAAIGKGMKEGEKYFLAFLDNDLVGYADVETRDGFIFMHKFYLDVSRHRKGIGEKFFHYVLSKMDDSLPMRLQVNRRNIKAVNFYFKVGFIIEKADDFDIGGGFFMNDFVMRRNPPAGK